MEEKKEDKVEIIEKVKEEVKEFEKKRRDLGNEVLVGKKENRVYIDAILIQLNSKNQTDVVLSSMGKNIEKAIKIAFQFIQRYDSFIISKAFFHMKELKLEKENKVINVKELQIIISKLS